eukprot:8687855-Alexandrium_andersonii.AAC.1
MPAVFVFLTDGINVMAAVGFRVASRTSSRESHGSLGSLKASKAAWRLPCTSTLPSGVKPQ